MNFNTHPKRLYKFLPIVMVKFIIIRKNFQMKIYRETKWNFRFSYNSFQTVYNSIHYFIQNQSIVNTINSDRSFYNDGFYFRLFLVFSSTKKSKEKGISVIINLVSQRLSKQTDGFALTKITEDEILFLNL